MNARTRGRPPGDDGAGRTRGAILDAARELFAAKGFDRTSMREVARAAPASRLNLLLTDGTTIAATAWGDSLRDRMEPGLGTVVASEPYDDDPLWREVPDRTVLTADSTGVLLAPAARPAAVPPKEPCT